MHLDKTNYKTNSLSSHENFLHSDAFISPNDFRINSSSAHTNDKETHVSPFNFTAGGTEDDNHSTYSPLNSRDISANNLSIDVREINTR